MKLNKERVKKGFKNQLVSIGHMIIFNVISVALFWLSYVGTERTGHVFEGLFASAEYRCNMFFMIFSSVLFLIAFSIFYTKCWKKGLKKQVETHWIFVVLFIIASLIFAIIEIMLWGLVTLFKIGFGTISNSPYVLRVLVTAYIVIYIVLEFIIGKVKKRRNKI